MTAAWIVFCFNALLLALVVGFAASFAFSAWRDRRRQQVIEQLDRSRQALMDMEPITVRIGTPLYDQDLEDGLEHQHGTR